MSLKQIYPKKNSLKKGKYDTRKKKKKKTSPQAHSACDYANILYFLKFQI